MSKQHLRSAGAVIAGLAAIAVASNGADTIRTIRLQAPDKEHQQP